MRAGRGIIKAMIKITKGNLLKAPAEALVNTVNIVGVMGKGVALQFRQAYPEMYRAYEKACDAKDVRLGQVQVFDLGGLAGGPRWIINFPTKGHWKARSRLKDIETGLADLTATVERLGIRSIALPPLGCGNGGLDWADVLPRIKQAFSSLPNVNVLVFPPTGAPEAATMPVRTERPKMTIGQATLVALMDRYLKGMLDPFVSLLEVHKLMYFLKAVGEPLKRLRFTRGVYGPYAPALRHSLIQMENHLTRGFGEGKDDPSTPLELLPGAIEASRSFLNSKEDTTERINRVAQLIEGFEDPYGMELLSSVHWVMAHEPHARSSSESAIAAVHKWTPRKRKLLKPEHLKKAWQRLKDQNWDALKIDA
jgi:O-acetyl-ADP-ribose deacetylase (regulator of RNase III)